jgi:hypothetical protein
MQQKSSSVMTREGDRMALLFADVLHEFYSKGKTGALFAVVDRNTDHMVRFYFENGLIHHLSFGPLKGKECLERLGCCEFGMAIFCTGLKPPRVYHSDLPITSNIIATVKNMRKTIRGIRFADRGNGGTA